MVKYYWRSPLLAHHAPEQACLQNAANALATNLRKSATAVLAFRQESEKKGREKSAPVSYIQVSAHMAKNGIVQEDLKDSTRRWDCEVTVSRGQDVFEAIAEDDEALRRDLATAIDGMTIENVDSVDLLVGNMTVKTSYNCWVIHFQ
jgi:hypothetical protein